MKIFSIKPLNLNQFSSRVSPKLIRGRAVTCPYRLYQMKQAGISQIIDLRNSAFFQSKFEKFFCKLFGIKYFNYKYPFRSYYLPEESFFKKINNTITTHNGQTYIHCQYGKRRTGICVAIYEKECLKKARKDIFNELLNIGFSDMYTNKNPKKRRHLLSIYSDFVKRYYPELVKS